ncbi:N-acetylneuraminate epimerase [Aquisphaera giovannonii]|uniref:N-acetylneuraminate epimerase n=1 Tax=Aquisphaera giovannonii TaxID=406548 RepID=A0A5B9VX36_9BACT|nr:kelch repeat-containing protein [Aquisphaera giovannonii]QEH32431.1 N-acetylneuraminate epimerase [Aquisphaera giovannonii]
MSPQRSTRRPSLREARRRSKPRFRPALALLEERTLLTGTTISALSQYHSFITGVPSGPVLLATFTDSAPAPLGYTASIDWGDGSTSTGVIAPDPTVLGQYDVTASHTFSTQGVSLVSVAITNVSTSASRTVSSVDPMIIPAPVVTTVAPTGLAVGSTVAGVTVATFTDLDPLVTAADFSATIAWGDGDTSTGTITADPDVPGQFDVVTSKPSAYATAGAQTLSVTVNVLQFSSPYGWKQLASMPEARGFVTPVSTGGLIYEIGGANGLGQSPQTVFAYNPATNTWAARASLPGSDQALFSVAGPDGKIYALAWDPIDAYKRMDIYDPATDTWTSTGSLAVASDRVSMTTGPDGLIYMIGGSVSGSATATVYTFDPATYALATAASLPTARLVVGAVTGPDGRIYAIGGDTGSGPTAEVDAYDPATDTWTQVASLPMSLAEMAVGVGPTGLIYAIGGYGQSGWGQNAFAYDPTTDTWAASPSLPTWRLYEGGTAGLDGRIYIMGNAGPSAEVFAFNPFNTFDTDTTTVNVAKGTPTITWANPGAILSGTALGASQLNATSSMSGTFVYALPSGTVLPAGLGQALTVTFTPDDATNYNPTSATVHIDVFAPPTVTVASPTLVVGQAMTNVEVATFTDSTFPGATASDFAATITWADSSTTAGVITADPTVAGLFHVSASGPSQSTLVGSKPFQVSVKAVGQALPGVWSTLSTFDDYLYYLAAAQSGGKIYIIGGHADGALSTVRAYDPAAQTLSTVAPLPIPIDDHAATTGPDGTVYVLGGDSESTSYLNTAYAYDPATDTWTQVADLPTGRDYLSAATGPDGKIYAIGGYGSSGYTAEVDAYDPGTGTWTQVAPLPVATAYASATTGPDGRIYLIGGYTSSGYTSSMYAYDTATDTWTQVADLPIANAYLSAATASDGTIYAIGGYDDDGYVAAVYSYDVATDTWTQAASLADGNYSSGVATGADGQVYLIGGYLQSEDYPGISVLSNPGAPAASSAGSLSLIAGPATSFVVTADPTGTAGDSLVIHVTAYDAYGNVATGYTGPVQLTSSDPDAVLPSNPTLTAGVGTFTIAFRSAGGQSLTVADPGSPDVSGTGSVSVAKAQAVAGALSASPSQSSYGQPLTLTATYSSPGAAPTGMVDFYDGDTYLGSAPLVPSGAGGSATAQFTIATLGAGSHAFRSVYSGDANNLPASSQAGSAYQVSPAATSTSLAATKTSQGVTLVATVAVTSPGSPAIAGMVFFYDGDVLLGSAAIVDGVATFSVASLSPGAHAFRAVFSGDGSSSTSEASVAFNPNGPDVTPDNSGGPKVIGLSRYGVGAHRTTLALKFDGPLNPADASNAAMYRIRRRGGRRIAVRQATYHAATNTVELVTARRLRLFRAYNLVVSPALTGSSGAHLDGSGTGHPGTAFAAKVRWTALTMPGRDPAVTFVNGHATSYAGRFRQYVRNVLHTSVVALRAASFR